MIRSRVVGLTRVSTQEQATEGGNMDYTPEDRAAFWARVNKNGPTVPGMVTPCWIWTGAVLQADGYGQVSTTKGRSMRAHKVAWEMVNGPIPKGKWVLHRCDVPLCMHAEKDPSLSHHFLGGAKENSADMVTKGRSQAGDRNPSRRCPERMSRGGRHSAALRARDFTWSAKLARGERSGRHTKPERTARGERSGAAVLTDAKVLEIRAAAARGETQESIATRHGVGHATISRVINRKTWRHV
jgi:hypothetical protein